jgi:hypothetical protein
VLKSVRVMVMVLESNGHGVGESRSLCSRLTVMVLECNGHGMRVL